MEKKVIPGWENFKARPDVISYDDIVEAVPWFGKHPKLTRKLMHILYIDRVNFVHGKYCENIGIDFSTMLATEEYKWQITVDNHEVLERFKEGPFITVSNHPFGSYDGIILLHLVGSLRPDFKVMVNLILNNLQAMQPGFIAVDPMKSDDPEKRKITMRGMREAIKHVKEGHPLGFFPAGAISKYNRKLQDINCSRDSTLPTSALWTVPATPARPNWPPMAASPSAATS